MGALIRQVVHEGKLDLKITDETDVSYLSEERRQKPPFPVSVSSSLTDLSLIFVKAAPATHSKVLCINNCGVTHHVTTNVAW